MCNILGKKCLALFVYRLSAPTFLDYILCTILVFNRKQYALVRTSMFIYVYEYICCRLSLYDCRLLGVGVERLD
jgi:hypothetical protein